MFSLTIVFGPTATNWRLLFKSKETLDAQVSKLNATPVHEFNAAARPSLTDDFGQCAVIRLDQVHGWMIENMDESKLGAMEYGVHNARAQASYQARLESDPTCRAAASSRRNGPSMIDPMGRPLS